jgi:hypothetical protein
VQFFIAATNNLRQTMAAIPAIDATIVIFELMVLCQSENG